jgi:hypothetical protein
MQASVHCTEFWLFNMQLSYLHRKVMNAFQGTASLNFSPSRVLFGIQT